MTAPQTTHRRHECHATRVASAQDLAGVRWSPTSVLACGAQRVVAEAGDVPDLTCGGVLVPGAAAHRDGDGGAPCGVVAGTTCSRSPRRRTGASKRDRAHRAWPQDRHGQRADRQSAASRPTGRGRRSHLISAALTIASAFALRGMAKPPPRTTRPYKRLVAWLGPPLRQGRAVRHAITVAAAGFAAFSIFRTATLSVTGAPHHWSTAAAGLLGLVGVTGTATAPVVGGYPDRDWYFPAASTPRKRAGTSWSARSLPRWAPWCSPRPAGSTPASSPPRSPR